MRYIFILFLGAILSACSSAGPYVTNISRNKNGDLIVEKCMLEHNAFLGTVYNDNCTNQSI